ncbi:MAG: hypothetical protein KOO63_02980 [Bacteroidales bacterium]|nr:hypothetical protein [Candidatus Latescibacterota bacterium]
MKRSKITRNQKQVFGYKTADGPDLFTTFTIRGFVRAYTLADALKHFGIKMSTGYDTVAALSPSELRDERRAVKDRVARAAADLQSAKTHYRREKRVAAEFARATRIQV